MHQIPETDLWLGNAADLRNIRSLLSLDVTAIIDLAIEDPIPPLPRVINYCRFTVTDDGENDPGILRAAIVTTSLFLAAGHVVAICCGAGLSRSPAIAAAALSDVSQRPLNDSLKVVANIKQTDISPALWNQITNVRAFLSEGPPAPQ